MSVIRSRLLPLIRLSRDTSRHGAELQSRSQLKSVRLFTTKSDGDGNDESKKLEKVVKEMADMIGGKEGEETKDTLMKMVRLQAEESKEPSLDVINNINNILKDLPVQVSEKMTQGMERKAAGQPYDRRPRELWKDRPPSLPPRQPREYGQFSQKPSQDSRMSFQRPLPQRGRVNYYSAAPLNLFKTLPGEQGDYSLSTWKRLTEEELDLVFRQPPRNAFDEMIQLTKEGKLWTFPINNEAGLEEVAKVPFYEHVFLDHLLEGIPESGPVKEFMDIILIGVSNNPYTTVERKTAIINWYVNFFKEKEPILKACGAL